MEHNGVQIGHPLLLFPLPLPRLAPGGVSKGEGPCPRPPSPWGLVSKGGGQGPRPLCRFMGVRGEIEIPPRFSLGGPGGTFSFQKRISPLASAGNPGPLWKQTVLSDFKIKQKYLISRYIYSYQVMYMRTEILKYGRIRDLRNDRGLTQKDVANVLHVSQNTYSQYEIGVSRYPLDAIIKLAEYYGVSIDYLVGLTDEPKPYPRKKK